MTKEKKLIEEIALFPSKLVQALEQVPRERRDTPCGPGEWTVRQVVHHLADAHINGYNRMKLVVTEDKPLLKPYDQDAWILLPDMDADTAVSMAVLEGLHARWHKTLSGLPETDWKKQGVHMENGIVSLEMLLKLYVEHGMEHLEQIQRAVA